MTTFVLSHNPQVPDPSVTLMSAAEFGHLLEQALDGACAVEILNHPHWLVRLSGPEGPRELGERLGRALLQGRQRQDQGHSHAVLALGGRKDSPASPGSPLEQGAWGVDVVETKDPETFKQSISWEALKGGRPADGVFEVAVRL